MVVSVVSYPGGDGIRGKVVIMVVNDCGFGNGEVFRRGLEGGNGVE